MQKCLYQYLNFRVERKIRKTDADIIIFDHIKLYDFDVYKKCDFIIYVNTPFGVCEKIL